MTEPVRPEQRVITAQIDGAAYLGSTGVALELPGEHHSPERIMYMHGVMTGHDVCTCPVVDEHGHNVNPGRGPVDGRAIGRAEGSRKASETYARRRARKAADELAVIDPRLWDDETRRIVLTLATLCAPSRVDEVLVEHMPITDDELEHVVAELGCSARSPITESPCVLGAGHDGQHVLQYDVTPDPFLSQIVECP